MILFGGDLYVIIMLKILPSVVTDIKNASLENNNAMRTSVVELFNIWR